MASMEMHSFTRDPLLDNQVPDLVEERINTAYGKVKISIYGNRSKHPLITFHDLALDSDSNFQNFFQFVSIAEFTEKFCIYNINAPGQEVDAQPLPDTLQSVIAFGVGVGANVLLRYAVSLLHLSHRIEEEKESADSGSENRNGSSHLW
ncbi:Ndr family protein [Cooperia oncophora]